MSMGYIRKFYGVPAKRGGQIRLTKSNGEVWYGKIVGAEGAYLRVVLVGFPRPLDQAASRAVLLHPTWNVEYLDGEGARR